MAKLQSDAYWPALARTIGVDDTRTVRRIVIDFQSGEVPIIHVEMIGDEHLLSVVQSLNGVEIKREGD